MSARTAVFALFLLGALELSAQLVWPTESAAFAGGAPYERFIQPTRAGLPQSGLFGDVRSSGYRFHEGIDIKPERRSKNGEALDEVRCALDGVVATVNTVPGNSGYGRYIVVVHDTADVPVYSLYAHLSSVGAEIVPGKRVRAGQALGVMGRSASYGIPKAQAHLHFEFGLRISDAFQKWYDAQKFGSPNFFGNYNGMNLFGFDPLEVFTAARDGTLRGFKNHIQNLPTAYVVRVYTKKIPDFVKNYPMLVDYDGQPVGWDIYFTWFGLPQKFKRIDSPRSGARDGDVEVVMHNPSEMRRNCRRFVTLNSKDEVVITDEMKAHLRLIF